MRSDSYLHCHTTLDKGVTFSLSVATLMKLSNQYSDASKRPQLSQVEIPLLTRSISAAANAVWQPPQPPLTMRTKAFP